MGGPLPARLVLQLQLLVLSVTSARPSHRTRASLDFGWRFKAFPTFGPKFFTAQDPPASEWPLIDDSSWRDVNVPHDFVVEGSFNESVVPAHACGHCLGYLAPGVGWYRKTWVVPATEAGKASQVQPPQ